MSLSELAGKVYCSRSFLSRVENGRRRASLELAQLCDEVLGAKGALVGLAPLPGSDAVPKAVRGGAGERAPGRSSRRSGTGVRPPGRTARVPPAAQRGDLSHTAGEMREAERHYTGRVPRRRGDPRAQAEAVIRMARRWSDPGQVDRELLQSLRGQPGRAGRRRRRGGGGAAAAARSPPGEEDGHGGQPGHRGRTRGPRRGSAARRGHAAPITRRTATTRCAAKCSPNAAGHATTSCPPPSR
jgi:transcriptional regulator with XRE-family HTH domain